MKNVGRARNCVKYQKNDCKGNWNYDNNNPANIECNVFDLHYLITYSNA